MVLLQKATLLIISSHQNHDADVQVGPTERFSGNCIFYMLFNIFSMIYQTAYGILQCQVLNPV